MPPVGAGQHPHASDAMSHPGATKGCHNCRRRRLRCDRSVPTCIKCSANGEDCLGYGTLLRWTNVPAVKGKLAHQLRARYQPKDESGLKPKPEPKEDKEGLETVLVLSPKQPPLLQSDVPDEKVTIIPTLLDPFFDGMSAESRYYIRHFSEHVCRDLVSVDRNAHNPFRIMIPLIQEYDYLQAIVVATSAMHLATLNRYNGLPAHRELVNALAAKGKAIRLLRAAIDGATPGRGQTQLRTAVLTAIVFFVNLELIDSGRGAWESHVSAAETLISSLRWPSKSLPSSLAPQSLSRSSPSESERQSTTPSSTPNLFHPAFPSPAPLLASTASTASSTQIPTPICPSPPLPHTNLKSEESLLPFDRLATAVAADCLTYRILGSTISGDVVPDMGWNESIDLMGVLTRAEAHSYHCCPPSIMHSLLAAGQICARTERTSNAQASRRVVVLDMEKLGREDAAEGRREGNLQVEDECKETEDDSNSPLKEETDASTTKSELASLFTSARIFDVRSWVYSIKGLSPDLDDLEARVNIASAHRAAACLYILLLSPPGLEPPPIEALDKLVLEILEHLNNVPTDHVLLKGTVWPTFIAGAQTDDPKWREWCYGRLMAVWTENPWICQWGYVKTAMEILQKIWDSKITHRGSGNWLHRLRSSGGRALIV